MNADLLRSKIYGCWMGKSIGGTLGLPVEGKLGPLSLTYYDPVPTIAPPNDDLELQLVWLDIVEKSNGQLTADDFGGAWLRHIHYMWDEYGRCRWNLRRGVPAAEAGVFENHFGSGMGSPIRSEIWACLFIGDPASAAYYAALDSTLDHGVEGIAGEVICALMQSLVAAGTPLLKAIEDALRHLPACETTEAIKLVLGGYKQGVEPWECRRNLLKAHDNENFTHAPLNVALAIWALLYGEGDFEKSILLSTNAGYDTDSTTATVGATLGLQCGLEQIPQKWITPIGDGVYLGPGIRDLPTAPKTLQDLTNRVIAVIGKLETKSFSDLPWFPTNTVNLARLPGTIRVKPHGATETIAWSNGDLPTEIKQAGGAEWDWSVDNDEPSKIVCLVREGASLYLDGALLVRCDPGQPYVPATHRCPEGTRIEVTPGKGLHRVRLDLDSKSSRQDATVILTYPDLHIRPWTSSDIPDRAIL